MWGRAGADVKLDVWPMSVAPGPHATHLSPVGIFSGGHDCHLGHCGCDLAVVTSHFDYSLQLATRRNPVVRVESHG